MQFLQKLWAAGQGFPYTPGESIATWEPPRGSAPWTLRRGTRKEDGTPVCIFEAETKKAPTGTDAVAKNAVRRLKLTRHPNVLTFVDSTEVNGGHTFLLVTEDVTPLADALPELAQFPMAVSWGIFEIAKALQFLNNDCKMVHGNLSVSTVFVTRGGDWKLGCMDFVGEFDAIDRSLLRAAGGPPPPIRPPECEKGLWEQISRGPVWAIDSFLLGRFVEAVFGKLGMSVPYEMQAVQQRLAYADMNLRPAALQLVECPYFANPYAEALDFLENIAIKDPTDKDAFFSKKLPPLLDQFPSGVCKYKILPQLIDAIEFGHCTTPSKVIGPLLRLGKSLTQEEFTQKVTPQVVKWFASPDKALRVSLLENIETYVEYVSGSILNDQIFPNICNGFSDQSAQIRDLTVRAMIPLVPKLVERNVNTHILKHFARLQLDPEPCVRTNTTVCIGKLAPWLNEPTRAKVLVPAFSRALQDQFGPARSAAVVAFTVTMRYYSAEVLAKSVVPAVSPIMVDPEKNVREEASRCIASALEVIEKWQRGEITEPPPTPEAKSVADAAMSAGWAVLNTLSRKLVGDDKDANKAAGTLTPTPAPAQAPSPAAAPSLAEKPRPAAPAQPQALKPMALQPQVLTPSAPPQSTPFAAPASSIAESGWGDGWDDPFEPTTLPEAPPAAKPAVQPLSMKPTAAPAAYTPPTLLPKPATPSASLSLGGGAPMSLKPTAAPSASPAAGAATPWSLDNLAASLQTQAKPTTSPAPKIMPPMQPTQSAQPQKAQQWSWDDDNSGTKAMGGRLSTVADDDDDDGWGDFAAERASSSKLDQKRLAQQQRQRK